jgi:NTE family protein
MRFRQLISYLTLLLFALSAHGAEEKIGLVLGGGGARGAAHVGVLKVLEREKVKIDFIAGTSMGAIVGGMYAAGYKADEIERRLSGTDWQDVLQDDSNRIDMPMERKLASLELSDRIELGVDSGGIRLPRGVIQGQKLLATFRYHLSPVADIDDFDRLAIPFRCVATDLKDGSAVVFKSGDLPFAIRASMSVPAVFQPVRDDQRRMLIDGMVADNVPINVARSMGATRLIVVDVGEGLQDTKELNSPLAVTNQVLSILMSRKTESDLATLGAKDVLIRPDLGTTSTSDFPLTPAIIAMGEKAALAQIADIRGFSTDAASYAQFEAQHRLPDVKQEQIAFIRVRADRSKTAETVDKRMSPLLGATFDASKVADHLQGIYADGRYERITYKTERDRNGRLGLAVLPVDKGWGPNFLRFGLALDSLYEGENSFRVAAELRMTGRNKHGGEWRTRADLGRKTGLRSEFLQPYGSRSQFYLKPYVDANTHSYGIARPQVRTLLLGIESGYDFSKNQRLRIFSERAQNRVTSNDEREQASMIGIGYIYDTLDNAAFPKRGARLDVGLSRYGTWLGGDQFGTRLSLVSEKVFSFGVQQDRTLLFATRYEHSFDDELNLLHADADFDGYGFFRSLVDAPRGNELRLHRVVYQRRFQSADKLFDAPVFIGASLESASLNSRLPSVFNSIQDSKGRSLQAGTVFLAADTFLGPAMLSYGRDEDSSSSVFVSFGNLGFARGN